MMTVAPISPSAMPTMPNRLGGLTLKRIESSAVATGESANMIAARPLPSLGMTEKVRKFGTT